MNGKCKGNADEQKQIMGNFSNLQERKKEVKEKDKVRREKLAGYFFDLSKLIFAALVLGGITPIFVDAEAKTNLVTILLGSFSTYIFAALANRTLK